MNSTFSVSKFFKCQSLYYYKNLVRLHELQTFFIKHFSLTSNPFVFNFTFSRFPPSQNLFSKWKFCRRVGIFNTSTDRKFSRRDVRGDRPLAPPTRRLCLGLARIVVNHNGNLALSRITFEFPSPISHVVTAQRRLSPSCWVYVWSGSRQKE